MSVLQRVVDRVKAIVAKAIVRAVDDTQEIQLLRVAVLADELQDGIERVQNYGLTSHPPKGAQALVLYLGGNKEHGVAVAVDSGKDRVTGLRPGETALYSMHGQTLLLDENGDYVFGNGAANAVQFQALKQEIDKLVQEYNAHTHSAPGGATGAPAKPSVIDLSAAKVDKVRVPQ